MATQREISEDKRTAGIGCGLDLGLVNEAMRTLEFVPVANPTFYRAIESHGANLAFEILEQRDITKKVVDSWLQTKENIERVASFRNKPVPDDVHAVTDGFAAIRLRREGSQLHFAKPGQTVVLIALQRLNEQNGFFLHNVEMEAGEDIFLDGGRIVTFPTTGGCLLIWITLDL